MLHFVEIQSRYLAPAVALVLPSRMVFLGGPRQVGKTTLTQSLVGRGADETHPAYFKWAEGLEQRFGLFQVDYETQERVLTEGGRAISCR